jgi:hypothetical protein
MGGPALNYQLGFELIMAQGGAFPFQISLDTPGFPSCFPQPSLWGPCSSVARWGAANSGPWLQPVREQSLGPPYTLL